jgi:hypothetical protein
MTGGWLYAMGPLPYDRYGGLAQDLMTAPLTDAKESTRFVVVAMKSISGRWNLCRRNYGLFLILLSVGLADAGAAFALELGPSLPGPRPGPWGGLSVGTGYFGHKQGADISFVSRNQASGSLQELRQQIDLAGVDIQLAAPVKWCGSWGAVLGGGYSLCFSRTSIETVQITGAATRTRTWQAEPQSFDIYAALTMDLHPFLTGVAGLKYDNFQTNLRNPDKNFGTAMGTLDSAAITLSTFQPQFGLVIHNGPALAGFSAQIGLLVSPVVLGNLSYRETVAGGHVIAGKTVAGFADDNTLNYGYCLEAGADSSFVTANGIQLGAYVKYYTMQANTNMNPGRTNDTAPDVSYKCELQKRSWAIGGRACLFF